MMSAKIKNICPIIVFVVISAFLFGCAKANENNLSDKNGYDDYGYVLKCGKYIYYYDFTYRNTDLFRYDCENKEKEYIDNITNAETNFCGVVRMYLTDDRIYYGKSTSDDKISHIYSITNDDLKPRYEAAITAEDGESMRDYSGETLSPDYRIMKIENGIYALIEGKLYRFNNGDAEIIKKGVTSIDVDKNNIYYSLREYDGSSTGIFRYNIKTKTNKEIIAAETIKSFNAENTIHGDQVYVSNIAVDDDNIYFIAAPEWASIFRYKLDGNTGIEDLTGRGGRRIAAKFRVLGDKIYYVAGFLRLHCFDTKTGELNEVIHGKRIYSYNVYDNLVYYYEYTDTEGSFPELRIYNMETGEDKEAF